MNDFMLVKIGHGNVRRASFSGAHCAGVQCVFFWYPLMFKCDTYCCTVAILSRKYFNFFIDYFRLLLLKQMSTPWDVWQCDIIFIIIIHAFIFHSSLNVIIFFVSVCYLFRKNMSRTQECEKMDYCLIPSSPLLYYSAALFQIISVCILHWFWPFALFCFRQRHHCWRWLMGE